MVIDPKAEQGTRTMLGHAIRHELQDLAGVIGRLGDEGLAASVPLCVFASAYVAIDVSGRWPTDADVRDIAMRAAKSLTRLDISEQQIGQYLSRVALGPGRLDEVFPDEKIATIPLFAAANLLLTFCPRDKGWDQYLDQIWDAAETAGRLSLTVLPALMLRARSEQQGS